MIVRVQHLRLVTGYSTRPGICAKGAREWFEARGWDWRDFVRNGVDADRLRATGDAFAIALADAAEAQHGQ